MLPTVTGMPMVMVMPMLLLMLMLMLMPMPARPQGGKKKLKGRHQWRHEQKVQQQWKKKTLQ